MKKLFFTLTVLSMFAFTSCNSSKKGAWSQADKDAFNEAMAKVDSEMSMLGDKKQAYIDCYFEKVQANYDSFSDADTDHAGCEKYATECAQEILSVQ